MGYRIDYGPRRVRRLWPWTAAWLLVFLLLVSALWPRGREVLEETLFPGGLAAAGTALEGFAGDLQAGRELPDAVEAFCRSILEGAGFDSD